MQPTKSRSARGIETRDRIIRAARELFHKQGMRATSPDEIIEASATGKGQFYHYFRSKDGLVHEVLRGYLTEIVDARAPIDYHIASWSDLERWFISHLELQRAFNMTRGCPFGTIASEVGERDDQIREDLVLIFDAIKGELASFFAQEKANGTLVLESDADALADFCLSAIQGAMLLGKVRRSSDLVRRTITETLRSLERYRTIAAPTSC